MAELKYTPEYVQSEVKRAKDEYGVAYFPGMFSDLPGWEDFIENLNVKRQKKAQFEPHGNVEVFIGEVTKRRDADFYFYGGSGESEGIVRVAEGVVKTLRDGYGLSEILNGGPVSTGTFVNFAVEGFNVPAHGDDRDTIFLQCIGRTRWTLTAPLVDDLEDRENPPKLEEHTHLLTVELEPGDMIYIGHRVRHAVEIFEPRAGIAFKATL